MHSSGSIKNESADYWERKKQIDMENKDKTNNTQTSTMDPCFNWKLHTTMKGFAIFDIACGVLVAVWNAFRVIDLEYYYSHKKSKLFLFERQYKNEQYYNIDHLYAYLITRFVLIVVYIFLGLLLMYAAFKSSSDAAIGFLSGSVVLLFAWIIVMAIFHRYSFIFPTIFVFLFLLFVLKAWELCLVTFFIDTLNKFSKSMKVEEDRLMSSTIFIRSEPILYSPPYYYGDYYPYYYPYYDLLFGYGPYYQPTSYKIITIKKIQHGKKDGNAAEHSTEPETGDYVGNVIPAVPIQQQPEQQQQQQFLQQKEPATLANTGGVGGNSRMFAGSIGSSFRKGSDFDFTRMMQQEATRQNEEICQSANNAATMPKKMNVSPNTRMTQRKVNSQPLFEFNKKNSK